MERPRRTRHTSILIGIGLVLIGLLGGILVMLFIVDLRLVPARPSPVVEPVQLGNPAPLRTPLAPDSEEAAVDMFSINRMFKKVADHVTPAVVYIQVEGPSSRDLPRDWFHNFEGDEDLQERFFREMPRQSVGSGVLLSSQGYIVTNHHVVDRASGIQVTLADKRQFKATVIGVDPSTDLAVVKIDQRVELQGIPLGDSDQLQVGEWVLAIGKPFRLTSTVTAGIVSALGRQVNIIEDRFRIEDFIQTDAAINPGNSGGALVNLRGELVGINTAIATEGGSYEGYGFAVPVNLVERVVRDLIAYGEVQRGFLGVSIEGVDAAAARRLGLDQIGGVFLSDVARDGAAFRGGLRRGDVVLSIEGRRVNAPNELQSSIARHRPGDQLALEVWRKGKTQQVQVQLLGKEDPAYRNWFAEEDAEAEAVPERRPRTPNTEVFELEEWGLGVRELTNRERNGFDAAKGVYVAYVEKGNVAARAGLPRDVVILRVDEEAVGSVEEFVRMLQVAAESSDAVLLRVKRRNGLLAFYELEVPVAR